MLIKVTNGAPEIYSLEQLRKDNPRTSIPNNPSALAEYGVYEAIKADAPQAIATQIAEPNETPELIDGVWTYGWTVRDRTIAELPYQTADEAVQAMVQWIDALTAKVLSKYPAAVRERWPIEEAAARAVKADDGSATQDQIDLINREAAAKNRTAVEHCDRIIGHADNFRAIADQINTLFLATDKALEDAASPTEYPAILENAIAQAQPLAQAYGL